MESEVVTNPKVSLLRPDQIDEMEGEREGLKRKLSNPNIEDKGVVAEQLRRLDNQLESQRPRDFGATEVDNAVRREAQLRAEWTEGMLSAEEMRKCPPGAVDRHLAWEKKNKGKIAEWQNIQRRLNAGSDAREVASIERFRPLVSRMNMDNALIAGKQYMLPPVEAKRGVPFTDEQLALLKAISPEIAERIATLTNEQRAEVKQELTQAQIDGKRGVEIREAKKVLSPEHLAKMKAGRERAKEKAAA